MRNPVRALHRFWGIRGWTILALLAAVAAAVPFAMRSRFVRRQRAAFALRSAEGHLAARDPGKAVAALRSALRLEPENAAARARLAAVELERGNWEIAFLENQSLTELHPEDPEGWIGLASLMVKSGLLSTPEAALDKAIARAPERADARRLRATVRYRAGRYHGAAIDADAAAKAAGDAPTLHTLRTCIEAKRTGAAPPPDCERMFGVAPVPAARFRAEAQAGGGKLAALSREHWPGRMAQLRQALEMQLRKQDWPAAERIVGAARQAYPSGPFGPFVAGILELARGRAAEAEPHFFAALAVAPRSAVVASLVQV